MKRLIYTLLLLLPFCIGTFAQNTYNIADFGAKGDGTTVNTKSIQDAIDKCTSDGGGKVIVPNGVFVTGTIYLKNNVTLYLNETATLQGVIDEKAYPNQSRAWIKRSDQKINADSAYSNRALIYAFEQNKIAIEGKGTIYGQGEHPSYRGNLKHGRPNRPHAVYFVGCTNVTLRGITLKNSACWAFRLALCKNVTYDNVNLISRVVGNNDGLDIVDCWNVIVANSFFDCGDDCICPKSDSYMGVKNLVVTNCIIKSESNGIKFGTGSIGSFTDVTMSNCVIYDCRFAGIALEIVDGGSMNRIAFNNITMHNVNGGIFAKIGQREGDKPGSMKNISFSNIIADGIGTWKPDTTVFYHKPSEGTKIGMSIVGQPGYCIENVTLNNIYMQFAGGGTLEDAARKMEDKANVYPEYSNFGVTSAYAFNVRHVKGIQFNNVDFDFIKNDDRPAMFFEDASEVIINRMGADISEKAKAFIRLKDVNDVLIQSSKPTAASIPFVSLEGNVKDVTIMNNDLHKVKSAYILENKKFKSEVRAKNN